MEAQARCCPALQYCDMICMPPVQAFALHSEELSDLGSAPLRCEHVSALASLGDHVVVAG